MFTKILIANRGEIACRVIKTARQMGIQTVAVYSDADANALHVEMADEAIHIGPAPSRESYLVMENIIAAAKQSGAQAIHPGYGFLSENAAFCQLCAANNITFIGPPVAAIEAMGSKSAAKTIMEQAGVPLVPGYHGDKQEPAFLQKIADDMGYPVLLKAAAGGGGKGMRQVWAADEFAQALAAAKREALNAFNDDIMLVEKYLTQPRHVEIQVFCDQHGNAVYLAERDCSVQRRHQKVIEEAPAPGMTPGLRRQMGEAALAAAQAINYAGAGTVEFLLDSDGAFYFMEMNTRLQVEHPVTEKITGQDLVAWQLRVACGETLPLTQDEIPINGHAVEVRIYAEDPANDFLPATGTLAFLQMPAEDRHIRVDTGVRQGDEVSVYYDPMIAKLISWDEDRTRALQRMARALDNYYINGVTTNIPFLRHLVSSQPFMHAELDTGFIEKQHELLFPRQIARTEQQSRQATALAALYLVLRQKQQQTATRHTFPAPYSPWQQNDGWRLNAAALHQFDIALTALTADANAQQAQASPVAVMIEDLTAQNKGYRIHIADQSVNARGELTGHTLNSDINGCRSRITAAQYNGIHTLYTPDGTIHFRHIEPDLGKTDSTAAGNSLSAPMNGTIVTLLAEAGATVAQDDALLVMEAMKMEHTIRAPAAGVVREFYFRPGDLVDGGAELLAFEPDAQE